MSGDTLRDRIAEIACMSEGGEACARMCILCLDTADRILALLHEGQEPVAWQKLYHPKWRASPTSKWVTKKRDESLPVWPEVNDLNYSQRPLYTHPPRADDQGASE